MLDRNKIIGHYIHYSEGKVKFADIFVEHEFKLKSFRIMLHLLTMEDAKLYLTMMGKEMSLKEVDDLLNRNQ